MNKKGLQLDKYLIGFIIFSAIMVGTLYILNGTITDYELNNITTDEFNDTYDKINETYDLSQDIKNATVGGDIEGGDQSWDSLIKSSYSGITLVTGTFSMIGTVAKEIVEVVGIPPFFLQLAFAAITILVIFAIIFMIFRFKG
jgi:hypothetical protein